MSILPRVGLVVFAVALCLSAATASPAPSRPSHEGMVVLFGNLHAHSDLSDDVSEGADDLSPLRAFEYAHAHGLDFLAISDHHKGNKQAGVEDTFLRMTPQEYRDSLLEVARRYSADHPKEFIAIPGIEWGTTATGNHINLFGMEQLPPDTILDADYNELIEWAGTHADFAQFNHPASWRAESKRNKTVGNFGQALYATPDAFVTAADASVRTCSIISTVRGGHITGALRHSEAKTHRELHAENYAEYKGFLNLGMKLAPAANQDTHWRNWGTVTAARTAVWAKDATYDELVKAIRARRVYATEDDELSVAFQVRYKSRLYWMGETVPIQGDEADVELCLTIAQGADRDTGAVEDEGPYTVRICYDADGPGGQQASQAQVVENVPTGVMTAVPFTVVPLAYLYIEVAEENGQDNALGDGDDEVNNGTGAHGADQKRDDMSDTAVTAPVWFVKGLSEGFVWSAKSDGKVYHDADCWSVRQIGAANKRTGAPPEGWTKHLCHP